MSKKDFIFGIGLAAILFAIALLMAIVVGSKENAQAAGFNSYYSELEKQAKPLFRDYLNEAGFENAGIMLTHTVDENENRKYTIAIHHSGFERLSESGRADLAAGLVALGFSDARCTFVVEYME